MLKKCIRSVAACFALCFVMFVSVSLDAHADTVQPLDVTDFGAVGDGLTDDRAAIQGAIDAAAAGSGGGVVTFPAGTYLVEEIVFLKSDVTLLLDDDATILNGINYSTGPSIIFMTGPFVRGGSKVLWEDTKNITIIGGTIDMNGKLNEEGSAAAELPDIGSSGAFALGYSDNVLIRDVTFLDSYKGHAIQVCACDGVTIRDCTFKGQSLPNILTDSQKNNLEIIQIEPSSTAGFPYAANGTGEASRNVTIQGCYFGASEDCGEPSVAIGTHNQIVEADKCAYIDILDNTFDNMMYAGVRFCGYEDVTIRGNAFIKKTEAESVNYRASGCFLINAYCYSNTTDELDLNRRITIDDNEFRVADPMTRSIRVAKDKDTYLGTVTDITITNNTITDSSTGSEQMGIQALRISDGLTITGNTIQGGYRGIEVQYCTGGITIRDNDISGLDYQYVRFISCGDAQTLFFYTHEGGTFEVNTASDQYKITAVPNIGYVFDAYYKQNALTDVVSTEKTLTYPIAQSTNVYRHASFVVCGHTYSEAVTAPTCTQQGYTTQLCTVCGYSYKSSYTAARGHSFTNFSTDCAAGCMRDGTATSVCDHGCGTTDTVTVQGSATGHCYGGWSVTVDATCTSAGSKERICGGCGDVQTCTIDPVDHGYEVTMTPASCKAYASFRFSCSGCGDSYTLRADQLTSQWIDTIPEGMDAAMFTEKTQYRRRELETVNSYASELSGHTFKSNAWVQSGNDTIFYVPVWPSGFNTDSSMYKAYDKADLKCTAFETDTQKTTVDQDGLVGYLYYHWCFTDSYYSQASSSGSYTTFHAYFSTISPDAYLCDTSDDSYKTMDPCCGDSDWFFVTEVHTQVSTHYRMQYTYQGWTDPTEWSDTVVTASDTCQVETRTLYLLNEAELGDHRFEDGSCTVCGTSDPDAVTDPGLTLSYPTLSFEDEIIYNVYYTVSDPSSIVEMGLMLLPSKLTDATIDDAIGLVPGYVTNGTVYLAKSEGIAAAYLGDTVYFKVYAKLTDGSYAYSNAGGYNAKGYASTVLNGDYSDEMKSLVVAMVNYGAEAQLYFGHNTDKLVNAALTDDQKALVQSYDEAMVDAVVSADSAKTGGFVRVSSNFKSLYPSVSFDGAFSINFYCTPAITVDDGMTLYYWDAETYHSIDQFTVDNATGSMAMTQSNGQYWGNVPGIAAKDMDKTYYVSCVFESEGGTITTGIIAYSLGRYCEGKAATDGDAQQAFAQATAVYGYYAKRYFASIA